MTTTIQLDRRDRDRRRYSWQTFLYGATHARRVGPRRDDDHRHYSCDRHDRRSFFIMTSVLVMCLADSLFTIHLLSRGAVELNPFMDYLIATDTRLFAVTKILMTGGCLLLLMNVINFRAFGRIRGKILLDGIAALYCLLIYWELGLLISN